MDRKSIILQDAVITRQINLLRFSAGEKKKVLAILDQLQKDLRLKLLTDLTDFGKARVNKLLKEATAVIAQGYNNVQVDLDFSGIAKHEAEFTAQSFAAIGLDAALPTEAALKALVNGSLIEGAPIKAWWSKQADNTAFFFNAAVRQEYQTAVSRGMSLNETVQQIVRRIIGSPRLGTPGIMETSRRGATALVHTSIQQVANDARLATFKANDDVIKGVQQLSTLDSKTTAICVAYSGASWDLDGNPINGTTLPFNGGPPRHWNCRSVLTAITKTYKELGIDIPEAPKGTRASDEGQVRSDITMTEWLKSKPTAYVDDLLGPGRSKLFLDGKITLQQLVDQTGRELTLEQLRGL